MHNYVRHEDARHPLVRHVPLFFIVALLSLLSVCCTGCIWLAVPSLAYEGYKYERQLKAPTSPGPESDRASTRANSGDSTSDRDPAR